MLSLSLITETEDKAKQLRHNIVHLLAGSRTVERDNWNLLLEMTNSFSCCCRKEELATSDDNDNNSNSCCWITKSRHRAFITWDRFAGDVLLALLLLAGGSDCKWSDPTDVAHHKISNVTENLSAFPAHPLPSEAQGRLFRFLSPAERQRCKALFLFAVLGHHSHHFLPTTTSRFTALLPLLLSFPTATSTTKQQQQHEVDADDNNKILRSIVAACITTLVSSASSSTPHGLRSLLMCVLGEKSDEPPSVMMESGFRIAEVLASPPVQHGCFTVVCDRGHDAMTIAWNPRPTSSEVVAYFASLLCQVGSILLELSPSRKAMERRRQQQTEGDTASPMEKQLGIDSTVIRTLCACLFFVGRLAAPKTQPTQQQQHQSINLRSSLAGLDLARLALIDRELLGPGFLAILRGSAADNSNDESYDAALFRLESLLFALNSIPGMVLSSHVLRSVLSVVALVWGKLGGAVCTQALSQDDSGGGVARSCVRFVCSTVAEQQVLSSNRSAAGDDSVAFLTSMLVAPLVQSATGTVAAALENNNAVFSVVNSILAIAAEATTAGNHYDESVIVAEIFKVSVALHEHRGRDSVADRAHVLFLCTLISRVDMQSLFFLGSSSASSVSSASAAAGLFEQLLRFCLWTLRTFSGNSGSSHNSNGGGLILATLGLLESLPAVDDLLEQNSKQREAQSVTRAAELLPLLSSIRDLAQEIEQHVRDLELSVVATNRGGDGNSSDTNTGKVMIESVSRNLAVIARSCDVMLAETDATATSVHEDNDDSNTTIITEFQQLFAELHGLFDRRMWSALSAVIMDIAHKTGALPSRLRKLGRHKNNNSDGIMSELRDKVFAAEVIFIATKLILVATSSSQGSSAPAAGRGMSARRVGGGGTTVARATSAAAPNTGDEQVVSASCSLLALTALLRLDGVNNDSTRRTVLTALHHAATNPGKPEAAAFAAAMLDVLVRIADDDEEGLTIRNVVFSNTGSVSIEQLLLDIAKAPAAPVTLTFHALRLCVFNILGSCYRRVPARCNFVNLESLIIGIFRSPGEIASSSSSTSDEKERLETQQLLRLAAAATLSSCAAPVAVWICEQADQSQQQREAEEEVEDDSLQRERIATLKSILALSEHLSQFRSGVQEQLHDAEIQEHGRIAQAGLRRVLPKELLIALQ